ncbi:MAG TPA: hypothetical protein VGM94_16660 [Galbitalea sp.]|jgi:hypothetical protein
MTEWRETVSDDTQDDLDRLADVTIAAARNFLDRNGQFIPFPMAVKADGELALVGLTQPDTPEYPVVQDVVDGIVDLFRDRRDSIRALAIASDVTIPSEQVDAIEVRLEHRDGIAITVLVPYRADPLDDSYEYDEPRAQEGERAIWA